MKISEERIKWVLRDYEGVLKYCDARYANYRRSYICEKQELQNFVLPKIDFEPRSSSGGDKRDLSDLYESWTERQKKFQKELINLMFEVEKEREEIHRIWLCFQMLPKKEYDMLALMMRDPHQVFDKSQLYEHVWGEPFLNADNTLNVHISNLRTKINELAHDPKYIISIWGIGVRLI